MIFKCCTINVNPLYFKRSLHQHALLFCLLLFFSTGKSQNSNMHSAEKKPSRLRARSCKKFKVNRKKTHRKVTRGTQAHYILIEPTTDNHSATKKETIHWVSVIMVWIKSKIQGLLTTLNIERTVFGSSHKHAVCRYYTVSTEHTAVDKCFLKIKSWVDYKW